MPERNLVTFVSSPHNWQIGSAICLVISLQLGCSKIGARSFHDLVENRSETLEWNQQDDENLEQLFLENPDSFETVTADEAVSTGNATFASNSSAEPVSKEDKTALSDPVRLIATTSARTNTDKLDGPSDQCNGACCNQKSAVPKLPFAEPIEPPVSTQASPSAQAPPSAIVSQPLTPILLKSSIQENQSPSDNEPGSDIESFNASPQATQNSRMDFAPNELSRRAIGANPIRIGNLNRQQNLRATHDHAAPINAGLADSQLSVQPAGHSNRRVAPISAEPIPPFADCPLPDEKPLHANIDFESAEPVTKVIGSGASATTMQVAANDFPLRVVSIPRAETESETGTQPISVSVQDLTDQEFVDLFGLPGVEVKKELKYLLQQRTGCETCGNFECTGCFETANAPSENAQAVEVNSQPDNIQSVAAEPPMVEMIDSAIKRIENQIVAANQIVPANQIVAASYQENAVRPQYATADPAPLATGSEIPSVVALRLLHAEFCTEIKGFGQVKRFQSRNFKTTQRVLVYCEVENHESIGIQTGDGEKFLTRLRGSYAIVDGQGRVVQQGEFPNVEDIALNKRRDFYLYFPIAFKNLPTGNYHLEVQVEDLTTNRSATVEPSLEFTVN